jgi:hypothetical protein
MPQNSLIELRITAEFRTNLATSLLEGGKDSCEARAQVAKACLGDVSGCRAASWNSAGLLIESSQLVVIGMMVPPSEYPSGCAGLEPSRSLPQVFSFRGREVASFHVR